MKCFVLIFAFLSIILFASPTYAAFSCDSGTLATTCYITTSQNVTDENIIGSGDLVIQTGGNLWTDSTKFFEINMSGNVTIESGGLITGNVNITASNANIQTGGEININSRGYAGGSCNGCVGDGPGGGGGIWDNGPRGGGGGGYGGNGGNGYAGGGGGTVYGSLTEPADFGSGGGAAYSSADGGPGGGAIRLNVLGTLTVNGLIQSNGGDGFNWIDSHRGGGGSGGSIWIETGTLAGNGLIQSNGGNSYGSTIGGGGAGGRIAVYYTNIAYSGTINAYGGIGYQIGGAGTVYYKQASQTNGNLTIDNNNQDGVYTPLLDGNYAFDNLIVSQYAKAININNLMASSATISSDGSLSVDGNVTATDIVVNDFGSLSVSGNLTISDTLNGQSGPDVVLSNGSITVDGISYCSPLNSVNGLTLNSFTLSMSATQPVLNVGQNLGLFGSSIIRITTLDITENLTISDTATITSSTGNERSLIIAASNLDIQAGGEINTDSKGYAGGSCTGCIGYGPGGGDGDWQNGVRGAGGAGYGGIGGNGYDGGTGGIVYGSLTEPTDFGSGGGAAYYADGGPGGGAIRLNISGILTVDGSIQSNGGNGSYWLTSQYGGGGAGGSILVETETITGTGSIQSNGGSAYVGTTLGGGGAGGRIAVYYTSNTFSGTTSVLGGWGYQYGGAGTTYLKSVVGSYPSEVNVSVAENSIYTGSGNLTSSVSTPSFVDEINTYISTCVESVPGYCDVPFEFEFSDAGKLLASGLSVDYTQDGTKARAMVSSEGLSDTTIKNFWFASKTGEVCMLNSYDIFLEVGDDYIGENASCSISCSEFVTVRALTACGTSTEFKGTPDGC